MSLNSNQVVVASRVDVWLGDVGTAAPVDVTTAPIAAWKHVGHTSPDSLSFNTEPEFGEVTSHQSDYPIRRFQTSDSANLSVDLKQWSKDNFVAAYGGGTVTETSSGSGVFKFVPPLLGARKEQAALVQVTDGAKIYRWVYARTQQVEGVTNELQKGQESILPLRLSVLGADGVAPFYMLTNDPAFNPAA